MVKKAVSIASMLAVTIGLSGVSPALADDATAIHGKTPAARCASATEAASRTGIVSAAATIACKQAVGWAHFAPDEMGAVLANNGVLNLVRGDYQAAIADFDGALREGGDQAQALNNRGLAEASLHRYDAAAADYTAALSKSTDHAERIYFNRAMAEEDLGNIKAAFLDYRKASELAPQWQKAAKELSRFKVSYPAMV